MKSKLNIDVNTVNKARKSAECIAEDMQAFIDVRSTVAIERTVCRLLGIDGVNSVGVPLPNVVVDHLVETKAIDKGAEWWIGNAICATGLDPQSIAEMISDGKLKLTELLRHSEQEIILELDKIVDRTCNRIRANRKRRVDFLNKYGGDKKGAYIYLIVATGNIYEDVVQAKAAARQGADVIAVIRTTGQSLLDYVPYGATTEGFGGTYATQENFRIMREALDEVGEEQKRYIRLCNYCSGLCMPEIAAMGALERLDMMLNDALYGILFRDINMQRTMVDQYFSRLINSYAGIIINTGEDNYLTTDDAYLSAHTVLASQFINEQFAYKASLPAKQMGLGHAFEMDPELKNGFLFEIAQAQQAREIFPEAPLKYMPPTKFMTGDIFKGNVQDALFNIATTMTSQKIHLLGMMTEAIHTPFMSDRAVAIENAKFISTTMADIADEIEFKAGGIIQSRAKEVLDKAADLLEEMRVTGLFSALEKGIFADIKRNRNEGKGLGGVFIKDKGYLNRFAMRMLNDLKVENLDE